LQKIKTEIKQAYISPYLSSQIDKEKRKDKIIVLNTAELNSKSNKKKKMIHPPKKNRLFRYINRLFFFIHHHHHIEDQRFDYVQPRSVHLKS